MHWKSQSLVNKAYSLIENNNYSEAIVLIKDAIEISPQESELYAYLGELYYLNKDLEQAEQAFQKREEVILQSNPITPYVQGYRGCIEVEKGNYENAHRLLETALEQDVKDPEIFYSLSKLHLIKEESDKSWHYLKEVYKLDPSYSFRKIQELIQAIKTEKSEPEAVKPCSTNLEDNSSSES